MGLTASQNPYFTNSGTPLTVSWKRADEPVEIWERKSKSSPTFEKRDLTDSEREQRKMTVNLAPGEIYTAALYEDGTNHPDPNQNLDDPPPSDLLIVVGILDQHKKLIKLLDGLQAGGTYIAAPVSIDDPNTFVLMQVGTAPPILVPGAATANNAELKQIEVPAAQDQSFDRPPPGTVANLECVPLIPGETYFWVIMAVDEDGLWDCKDGFLRTKLRKVDIKMRSIYIGNDGDPGGPGEGEFWVTVFESGTSVSNSAVRTFNLGNDAYDISDGQDITLPANWKLTIGPKKIDPSKDAFVSVHANGLEYDGIEGTEKAGSDGHDKIIKFPPGRDLEESEDTEVVKARPIEGDNSAFNFTVTFDWKVTYV